MGRSGLRKDRSLPKVTLISEYIDKCQGKAYLHALIETVSSGETITSRWLYIRFFSNFEFLLRLA